MSDIGIGLFTFSVIYCAVAFGGLTLYGSKLMFAFVLSAVLAVCILLYILWWATYALKCSVEELRFVKMELTRLNHLFMMSEDRNVK